MSEGNFVNENIELVGAKFEYCFFFFLFFVPLFLIHMKTVSFFKSKWEIYYLSWYFRIFGFFNILFLFLDGDLLCGLGLEFIIYFHYFLYFSLFDMSSMTC
eukprot:TRINITY_DN17561_c0_g1_i1.p1 TRINITY_DN17561_c0_g1~~TRINITY_DN17561_c0_g1_i1.p1  ORF type:complete len:101 (-),score=8.42 TRINITY_DN17561_c0_g1_i1:15-317(-)